MTYDTKKEIIKLVEQLAKQGEEGFYASTIQNTLDLESMYIIPVLHELTQLEIVRRGYSVRGVEDVIYNRLADVPNITRIDDEVMDVYDTDIYVFYQFNPTYKKIMRPNT